MLRRSSVLSSALLVLGLVFSAGCSGCGDGDPANNPDAAVDAGTDAPPGVTEVTCEVLPPVASGTCEVTAGGATKLLKGIVLTPTTVYRGGQVAVDAAGQITCVGCDCDAGGETVITCPDGAISPGLINTHDHITFTQNAPYTDTGVRYEHRHQWRRGQDGKPRITSSGGASGDQIRWGELRFLMGGATSIVGSGGQPGLLRNLDSANQEGLAQGQVNFDTFPLDDSAGTRRTSDCNYGGTPTTPADIASTAAYEPHTSEGIDGSARNEFLCQSSATFDTAAPGVSNNLLFAKTAMIHAIGLNPQDLAGMATAGTALIWSPRSNITLYGDTARVTTAARLGVEIALGTDWMPTGSMNLLRELRCADGLNKAYLDNYFSDAQLWQMVTSSAAAVTATDDVIGVLAAGKVADIAIFAAHGKTFRAVIDAEPQDVVLVMRGGKTLYGDATTVTTLAQNCDVVDVCGTSKQVCMTAEVGKTYAALQTAAGVGIYPAFTCGTPMNEPSCTPTRPTSVAGSTIYTGTPGAGDQDGDGLLDADDKCPKVFDPIRPLDGAMQGDADADGVGDVCDPCPLDANTTTCGIANPDDRDNDTVPNSTDNCPDNANTNQADADSDGKGDVCDACPNASNPGGAGCPATIYSIKSGMTPVGTAVRVVNALVTGRGTNGFFVQVKETDAGYTGADNSGLFAFTGAAAPTLASATVGARVTIEGRVANFQGQIELDTVTAVTVEMAGPEALPAPIAVTYTEVKTGGTRALTLESVIVSLGAASVTATNAMFGEFTLTSGADTLVVDDFLFVPNPAPTVGTSFMSVRGILTLRQAVSKLEPRDASDLTAGAPALASFGPALSYARVGTTANAPTFPTPLTVTLTGPAQGDTNVVIMSASGDLVVASVTVPNGVTSVTVPVTAVAQEAAVALTASLGVQMLTSQVRVLATDEGPTTVTLTPGDVAVAPGAMVGFTVTLDVPALPGGASVGLAATTGTVPANASVAANQIATTFNYTNAPATGTATVTATFAASSSMAVVTISTGANHLVINEVDYDQIGTDTTEYIEILNPSTQTISLANLQVLLINGSGNVVERTIELAPATSLAPNQYLVIANANVTAPAAAKKIELSVQQDIIQNGMPDGVALIDNAAHVLIDALSYEGSMTMVDLPGFTAPVSLVEGTAFAGADSNTVAGSLCRAPNGQDTDNAANDWKVCTALSAGTANP